MPTEGEIFLIVMGLVAIPVGVGLWRERQRTARYNERLRTAPLIGTGRVLDIEEIKENDSLPQMTLTLEIQIPGQPSRQARVYHQCPFGREPHLGDSIPLRVHPDHPQDIYLEHHLNTDLGESARQIEAHRPQRTGQVFREG